MPGTEETSGGTRLAERYRVLRRLGTGGMATVFLAEDDRLGREVAIKRLHTDAPGASLRRFRREAHLGAALNHPNFVAIHDTVADEDGALIVMEYVPGASLAELAAGEPLEPERALPILRAVADALDHAHSEGVVHRDVKPANVLVREDGIVKLGDLGIAKAIGANRITSEGSVIGTLPYMAPERLRGPGAGGPPSDIYGLAAVAYEVLSGRPPSDAASGEGAPARLRADWPGAPPGAVAVLERGMDPDPNRRQPTAGRFVDELEAVLHGRTEADTEQTVAIAAPAAGAAAGSAATPPRGPFDPGPATRGRATGSSPRPGPARTGSRRAGSRGFALATLAVAILAVTGIAVAGGGGGGEAGGGAAPATLSEAAAAKVRPGAAAAEPEADPEAASTADPGSQPSGETGPGGGEPDAAALNDLGFSLIGQGRASEAIPLLERAVAGSEGSDGLTHAYALFNLGHALRLAGRPEEAIEVLRRRLEIPNQQGTVAAELAAALEAAGEGGEDKGKGDSKRPGKGHGNAFGHERRDDD